MHISMHTCKPKHTHIAFYISIQWHWLSEVGFTIGYHNDSSMLQLQMTNDDNELIHQLL